MLVLVDLSAAFDTGTMESCWRDCESPSASTTYIALAWFRSYLASRRQHVRCGGKCSALFDVIYGVPQGSVFGPLLDHLHRWSGVDRRRVWCFAALRQLRHLRRYVTYDCFGVLPYLGSVACALKTRLWQFCPGRACSLSTGAPPVCCQCRGSSGVSTTSLRPCHGRPCNSALAASTTACGLQGAYVASWRATRRSNILEMTDKFDIGLYDDGLASESRPDFFRIGVTNESLKEAVYAARGQRTVK